MEDNNKDKIRNKWNRENENIRKIKIRDSFQKIQTNLKKTLARLYKDEKREDPSQQNYKWKGNITTDTARNTKDYQRLLWTTIHKQIGQPRRNRKILTNMQLPRLNQEKIGNVKRPITNKMIE